ncbi:MAG: hypothetical protein R3B46_09205 [Phycisphaerales bacterium]|nr:hypothetical protein [Phycisphaerales bacterium]
MPKSRRPANDALLCEHCGYDLAGLTRNDNCPECGKPIAESLPENRTGSAWQRGEDGAWRETAWSVTRRPVRVWGTVRNIGDRSTQLTLMSCFVAGAAITPFFAVTAMCVGLLRFGFDAVLPLRLGTIVGGLLLWIVTTLSGAFVFWVLTSIETAGISHFGKRRGWRTDFVLANVICGHASVMWVYAGALGGIGLGLRAPLTLGLPWLAMGGFLLGMLVFETWVYLGFRAMRYANPPGAERHLRDHAGEANISTEPDSPRRM